MVATRTVKAPKRWKLKFSAFLRAHLQARQLTQAEVARRLKVSPATITRLLRGEIARVKQISADDFARATELDTSSRREFLALAAKAGIAFAMLPVATASQRAPAVVRYRDVHLEVYEEAIAGWAAALREGISPREALAPMERVTTRLREMPASRGDVKIAVVRMRGGMLLAALQEAVLPWRTQRPAVAIKTYDELLWNVFQAVGRNELSGGFAREYAQNYARLLTRRAILLRERDHTDACAAQLHEFREEILEAADDPIMRVAYLCQRLHTKATMMVLPSEREIEAWQREGYQIREWIDKKYAYLSPDERQDLQDIVDYTMGVGWKSFMWDFHERDPHLRTPSPKIELYARKASGWLGTLRARGEATDAARGGRSVRYINVYHASISDASSAPELAASEIDALVWCEPEEALHRAQSLWARSQARHPAILPKLESNAQLASWRLGRRHSPLGSDS